MNRIAFGRYAFLDARIRRSGGTRVLRGHVTLDWAAWIVGLKMKWNPETPEISQTFNLFVYVGPFAFMFWTFLGKRKRPCEIH